MGCVESLHGKPTLAPTDTLQTLTARRSKSGGAVELNVRRNIPDVDGRPELQEVAYSLPSFLGV